MRRWLPESYEFELGKAYDRTHSRPTTSVSD